MGNLWLKFKIWSKVLLVVLALAYVIAFAVANSESQATFWYFVRTPPITTSVLKLVLIAFLSGVAVAVLARTTVRTVGQIRELKARQSAERREKEIEELKTKAGMLRAKPGPDAPPADVPVTYSDPRP